MKGKEKLSQFPIELLEKPIIERINYFDNFKVNHPIISDLLGELMVDIFNKGNHSILYVFGPTGVGKTTLYNKVLEKLNDKEALNIKNNPGIIPFLGTRAIAPESGNFDWKDFYIRTLEDLNEPLIHKKVLLKKEDELKYGAYHNDKSTKAYRKSIENALKYRNSSVFLIDEAQHLAKIGSGKKLLNQMDVIKSLAAETGTLIVLFGTYGLQNFLNLSDQLSRRGKEFHFPRYRYNNEQERDLFVDILYTFFAHLPMKMEKEEIENKLLAHSDFFYERSLGCIGILKDWIARTYRLSLLNGYEDRLIIDNFYNTALTVSQCLTIAEEITNGEKQQEENEEQRLLLLNKIGMDPFQSEPEKGSKVNNNKETKQKKRVGERKPKRDQVGVDKYA
ncbi:AAA family ATPase [Caldifermentibacillus hisashii]|uniref:ATP-binding protein n=1 Tax=Bacillaceae TaxID=186817 RepID=UPI002E24697E|nr:AAA family ATPase [Caldifermentibacillus hisashii]MED4853034.1 AAA family ATPase [Caldifermentibacillus hisashii]